MNILFIFGAKYLIALPVLIALYYFWKHPEQRKRLVRVAVTILPISYIIAKIGSALFNNQRPFVTDGITPLIQHVADNGFPSDHVLLASAISALFMFFNRKLASWLWLITILIAIARVMVGVHHMIDVVGSILISLLVAGVVYSLKYPKEHGAQK